MITRHGQFLDRYIALGCKKTRSAKRSCNGRRNTAGRWWLCFSNQFFVWPCARWENPFHWGKGDAWLCRFGATFFLMLSGSLGIIFMHCLILEHKLQISSQLFSLFSQILVEVCRKDCIQYITTAVAVVSDRYDTPVTPRNVHWIS